MPGCMDEKPCLDLPIPILSLRLVPVQSQRLSIRILSALNDPSFPVDIQILILDPVVMLADPSSDSCKESMDILFCSALPKGWMIMVPAWRSRPFTSAFIGSEALAIAVPMARWLDMQSIKDTKKDFKNFGKINLITGFLQDSACCHTALIGYPVWRTRARTFPSDNKKMQ